jgi:hypothetical protein
MADETYTFRLHPGEKKRYLAGPYDKEKRSPNYSYEIMIACHAESDITVKQFFMNFGTECQCGFDFHNTSSNLEAYIVMLKDGSIVTS